LESAPVLVLVRAPWCESGRVAQEALALVLVLVLVLALVRAPWCESGRVAQEALALALALVLVRAPWCEAGRAAREVSALVHAAAGLLPEAHWWEVPVPEGQCDPQGSSARGCSE
jgi:hypothetical protein